MDQDLEPAQYAEGTRVLGADGRRIGEVVAAHRRHLIVERGFFFPTSYFVPFEAVAHAERGDIVLAMTTAEALAQGWEVPPADPITEVAPAAPLLPNPTPDPTFPAPETAAAWRPATTAPAAPVSSAPQLNARPDQTEADQVASEPERPAAATPAEPVAAVAETVAPAIEPAKPEPTELNEARLAPPEQELAPPAKAAEAAPPAETAMAAEATTVAPAEAASIPVPSAQVEVAAVEPAAEAQEQQEGAGSEAPPTETQKAAEEPEIPFALGAPSIVPIPGRRLTDAELWALLDPKATGGEAGDESGTDGDPTDPAADTNGSKSET